MNRPRRRLRHAAQAWARRWPRLTRTAPRHYRPADPTIRTFLDLSTAHLQPQTCDELDSYPGVIAYQTTYGWLMYAPQDATGLARAHDWPPELLPIMKLAREHDCAYVLFDGDADQSYLLEVFDWSTPPDPTPFADPNRLCPSLTEPPATAESVPLETPDHDKREL
ncbi:hypothetical protein Ato02nite_061660 [Paractinoplanes toevensis]|uniref:DUF5983 domain-containing protein n=1 Tax=Paractinoplanes toevensis TaxID=571911 RepID=A0A919TEX7_9ACTN|nr:hypothetical protein Ato02nite_061660 [Actinoplanes toevensis]